MNFRENIKPFIMLGDFLRSYGIPQEVALKAYNDNPIFTIDNITNAANAIAFQMLDESKLNQWVAPYLRSKKRYLSCSIIMAGNIPMVGFLDMMAVSVCGIDTYIKTSSKDTVLVLWLVEKLKSFGCNNIYNLSREVKPEFIIATGGNNLSRYVEYEFSEIPKLIRSSRTSVAVLSGDESDGDIDALWSDIFEYLGLGCRNVTHLFIPDNYDINRLCNKLSVREVKNDGYRNFYLQNRAIKIMNNDSFVDGKFFIATESREFFASMAEITFSRYLSLSDVEIALSENIDKLQCVVRRGGVEFGYAQRPTLGDWADGVNLFQLLLE